MSVFIKATKNNIYINGYFQIRPTQEKESQREYILVPYNLPITLTTDHIPLDCCFQYNQVGTIYADNMVTALGDIILYQSYIRFSWWAHLYAYGDSMGHGVQMIVLDGLYFKYN